MKGDQFAFGPEDALHHTDLTSVNDAKWLD
jgi:hypothetical protein